MIFPYIYIIIVKSHWPRELLATYRIRVMHIPRWTRLWDTLKWVDPGPSGGFIDSTFGPFFWLVVFRPTPLKNDGVRQLGWFSIPNWMERHKIPWFQSPPTRFRPCFRKNICRPSSCFSARALLYLPDDPWCTFTLSACTQWSQSPGPWHRPACQCRMCPCHLGDLFIHIYIYIYTVFIFTFEMGFWWYLNMCRKMSGMKMVYSQPTLGV